MHIFSGIKCLAPKVGWAPTPMMTHCFNMVSSNPGYFTVTRSVEAGESCQQQQRNECNCELHPACDDDWLLSRVLLHNDANYELSVTVCTKKEKQDIKLLFILSPNIDRLLEYFHWHTSRKFAIKCHYTAHTTYKTTDNVGSHGTRTDCSPTTFRVSWEPTTTSAIFRKNTQNFITPHTVVWECCKDDQQSQWEMPNFGVC